MTTLAYFIVITGIAVALVLLGLAAWSLFSRREREHEEQYKEFLEQKARVERRIRERHERLHHT